MAWGFIKIAIIILIQLTLSHNPSNGNDICVKFQRPAASSTCTVPATQGDGPIPENNKKQTASLASSVTVSNYQYIS